MANENVIESPKILYYKKTVPYVVGGRRFIGDSKGFVLTNDMPWVAVPEPNLRDFKIANKRAIVEGLIVETTEPTLNWETANVYTDDEIDALLKKGVAALRKVLPDITSVATVARMLERAKAQRKSEQMIDALEEKLEEIDHEKIEVENMERILDA